MNKLTLCICTFALLGMASELHANPPNPEPSGPRAGTFVPFGGYLRTVKRGQLERQAGPMLGAPPVGGLKGTRRLPVICVEFHNVAAPFPRQDYQDALFGNPTSRKTMTQYYKDMSNGMLNVTGIVLGWYKLPKDDIYYENADANGNNGNGSGKPFGELLRIGLEQADKEVDFGDFDNDGPDGVPNSGDDDGKVDTVMFIHPELGGEFRQLTPTNIWSHSWHYSEPSYGHSGPFETRDIRKDANGNSLLGANGKPQHIVVEDYVIQPGLGAPQPGNPKRIVEIGVFCHEFGHALGLPDLYDRTPRSSADSSGVGHWCLMAAGSYGGDGVHSETPAAMSAWCKQYLGWANILKIDQDATLDIEPVGERNQVYRMDVPGTGGKEYFLAEYRNREWQDATNTRLNWDQFLPGSGLAVWHIDERVGAKLAGPAGAPNPVWPFSVDDEGQNDAPSLPKAGSNPPTWKSKHSLVSLVQADRKLELERQAFADPDAGDLFATGSKWEDDSELLGGSRDYAGKATGFSLRDIDLANSTLTVQLGTGAGPHAPGVGAGIAAALGALPGASPFLPMAMSVMPKPAQALRAPLSTSELAVAPENAPGLARLNASFTKAKVAELTKMAGTVTVLVGSSQLPKDRTAHLATVIAEVNSRLAAAGAPVLDHGTAEQLKLLTEKDINKAFEPKNRPFVRSLCSQARTHTVTKDSEPSTAAEKLVAEVLKTAPESKEAILQVAASGDRVERVTDLSLPPSAPTIEADAQKRLEGGLGRAVTAGATLEKVETTDHQPGSVRFQQTVKVGEKNLPVWGAITTFFYTAEEKPKLNAVVSKTTAPETIKPVGQPGSLPLDEAKKIVATQLDIDESRLSDGSEGVKLIQADPKHARVAIRFLLPVGEKQRSLEIYVDSESKRILSIE